MIRHTITSDPVETKSSQVLRQGKNPHLAIDSKIRLLLALCLHACDDEFKLHLIDGDAVVTGVVLQHARQERLSEVEPWDPEHNRRTLVHPVL